MRHKLTIAALILLSVIFVWPFLKPGYFETDDGLWAIVRQASMHHELRQGQFPVRWSGTLNFGYGYPLFQFSYPGPYYLGEIFHLIGFSLTNSVKVLFVLGTVFSVVAMYLFARKLWRSDLAAVIAAIFYLAAPYRFVNLYVRGSLGETLAFLLFPVLCYIGLNLLQTGKRRYVIAGSFTLALLIINHNVMALLFTPFFLYFLVTETFLRNIKLRKLYRDYLDEIKNKKSTYKKGYTISLLYRHIGPLVIMFILGITLSASFWLPAVSELQYVKLSSRPLTDVEMEFRKQKGILLTPLDTHVEIEKEKDVFEENLEFEYILLSFAATAVFFFYKNKYEVVLHRMLLYMIPLVLGLVLLTPASLFLWKNLPGLKTIDFPWRVLGILSFISPVIIGAIGLVPRIKYFGLAASIISLLLIVPLVRTGQYHLLPDSYFATNQATTTSANEYLSRWMTSVPISAPAAITILSASESSDLTYKLIKNTSIEKIYAYKSSTPTEVLFPVMYFPGWDVFLDEGKRKFEYANSNGIIHLLLPEGQHTVRLKFGRSTARAIGDTITLASILGVGILCTIEYARGKRFVL